MTISSMNSSGLQRPDPTELRQRMFQDNDGDGNGSLSKAEFSSALENRPAPPPGGQRGGPGGAKASDKAPDAEELFSAMDSDGNGEVTEAEMQAFDEARAAERKGSRQAEFTGSTEFFQNLLQQLGGEEEDTDTSGSASLDAAEDGAQTASTTAARDELIAKLIKRLQEMQSESGTYGAGGATKTSTASLFNTVV